MGQDGPPPFAFIPDVAGRATLDRADRLRTDNAALDRLWADARVVLLDDDGRALAGGDGRLAAPLGRELSGGGGGSGVATFLGLDDEGQAWFSLDAARAAYVAEGAVDLRSAGALWPPRDAALFAEARALQHWHRQHRHCGACGTQTQIQRGGWQRHCPGCGLDHHPRTDPAVIVAVSDGARLLLGRQASWPARRWSVIAGFVEPGESLEQAVAREVLEETGLQVDACRYLASQPWPFPGQLMLGFSADARGEPQSSDELEQVAWFDRDAIAAARERDADDDGEGILLSPPLSISRWLIERWWADATRSPSRG